MWMWIAIVVALALGAWFIRRRMLAAGGVVTNGSVAADPGTRAPGLPLVGDTGGRAKPLLNVGDAAVTSARAPSPTPGVSLVVGASDSAYAVGGAKDGAYPR